MNNLAQKYNEVSKLVATQLQRAPAFEGDGELAGSLGKAMANLWDEIQEVERAERTDPAPQPITVCIDGVTILISESKVKHLIQMGIHTKCGYQIFDSHEAFQKSLRETVQSEGLGTILED